MKKLVSFFLASAFCICCVVPSFAAEAAPASSSKSVISVSEEELGNGFTVETVISIPKEAGKRLQVNDANQSRTAQKTQTVRHGSDFVGSMTMTVNFGYNGFSSWVNSISTSHSMASGWSFTNEQTWSSGGTANMSASMVQKLGFLTLAEVDPSMSLTCAPSGAIS